MMNRYKVKSNIKAILLSCILLVLGMVVQAKTFVGTGVGQNTNKGDFRIAFPLSKQVKFNSFRLDNPARLVVDIPNAELRNKVASLPISTQNVAGVRLGTQQGTDLRIVVDMRNLRPVSTALVRGNNGYELVILISGDAGHVAQSDFGGNANQRVITKQNEVKIAKTVPKKNVLIVIDPGHGGKDPGALGSGGAREKDVVLAIAKQLRDKINREKGMRAVLTRDRDVFIPLRERVLIARRHKADMFISVHADAGSRTADGASVYILSTSGASSEAARMLAKSENMSDLIGGVKISDKDNAIASMLLDISQDATIEASNTLGVHVLSNLRRHANLHKKTVERAGFAVLKAPDIPSVLVETGFISNPNEERKLRTAAHQARLADDILLGIKAYYRERPAKELVYTTQTQNISVASMGAPKVESTTSIITTVTPPANEIQFPALDLQSRTEDRSSVPVGIELLSQSVPPPVKKYTTQRGDTVQSIAIQFRIPVDELRRVNNLPSNQIRVPPGTTLSLP